MLECGSALSTTGIARRASARIVRTGSVLSEPPSELRATELDQRPGEVAVGLDAILPKPLELSVPVCSARELSRVDVLTEENPLIKANRPASAATPRSATLRPYAAERMGGRDDCRLDDDQQLGVILSGCRTRSA